MYPTDSRMLFEELRNLECILAVPLHAQRKRLQSLKQQERIEGTDAGAGITQRFDACLHHKGKIAKRFVKAHAMIPWRGIDDVGELAIIPGKLARLDQP